MCLISTTLEVKMEDINKKSRSPQFPFIPLDKCIARAREFEAQYGVNTGRPANVVKSWGYSEKSSGGIQTLAALSAFGLIDEQGAGDERKVKLSSLAMTILKDKRHGNAEAAIRDAALKPKVIQGLWAEWGANRPPNHECISFLHLDKNFTEDAAERLLKIYDATVSFAGLANGDKKSDEEDSIDDDIEVQVDPLPPQSSFVAKGLVPVSTGERVVFAHEIRPNQGFRILVTGEVDSAMLKALEAFARFQKELLSPSA
jgi:hypothetical protein